MYVITNPLTIWGCTCPCSVKALVARDYIESNIRCDFMQATANALFSIPDKFVYSLLDSIVIISGFGQASFSLFTVTPLAVDDFHCHFIK